MAVLVCSGPAVIQAGAVQRCATLTAVTMLPLLLAAVALLPGTSGTGSPAASPGCSVHRAAGAGAGAGTAGAGEPGHGLPPLNKTVLREFTLTDRNGLVANRSFAIHIPSTYDFEAPKPLVSTHNPLHACDL